MIIIQKIHSFSILSKKITFNKNVEQSIIEQDIVKDVKTVSVSQTYHIFVQNEIHHHYQTTCIIQFPKNKPQSLTQEKIKIRGNLEKEQYLGLEDYGKWSHNKTLKCLLERFAEF